VKVTVQDLRARLGDDWDRIKHMSIIDEDGSEKCAPARMLTLAARACEIRFIIACKLKTYILLLLA